MDLILRIKEDLLSEPDKKGRMTIIKENVVSRLKIDSNNIVYMMEIVNDKGKTMKNFTRLYIKESGPVTVNHNFNELNKMIMPKTIGFKK